MTALERLISDLKAMPADHRVLCWSGFDQEPYDGTMFREYLFPRDVLLAALTGDTPPPPTTISVRVSSSNGLNVRKAPIDGEKVTTLPDKSVITVYEDQRPAGWYKIAGGLYNGNYVSAQYVVKV